MTQTASVRSKSLRAKCLTVILLLHSFGRPEEPSSNSLYSASADRAGDLGAGPAFGSCHEGAPPFRVLCGGWDAKPSTSRKVNSNNGNEGRRSGMPRKTNKRFKCRLTHTSVNDISIRDIVRDGPANAVKDQQRAG